LTEQQLASELSSGARVTSLSQDPVVSGENVLLLNQIQRDDSFTQTSSTVTGQLQVADSSLGSFVAQLTSANSLATSANSGTMNSGNVQTISTQLSGILSEVTTLANWAKSAHEFDVPDPDVPTILCAQVIRLACQICFPDIEL
jgi:flagellar hook-associated protein 3 FlgL